MTTMSEGMATMGEGAYYRARLGNGAAARGERIICQLLGWTGDNNSLGRVRIIHSTVSTYRTGQVGLVPRERLIPVRPRQDG